MDQGPRLSRSRSHSCHRLNSTTTRNSHTQQNLFCELKHNDSMENVSKKKRSGKRGKEINETLLKSEELIQGSEDDKGGANDEIISKFELCRRFNLLMARTMKFYHPDDALRGDKTEKYALRYHSNFEP